MGSVKMQRSVTLLVIGVFAVAAALAATQTGSTTDLGQPGSGEIEARIARIENGLRNPFVLRGQSPYNLTERMEHYRVPGVSIAFFEHGQIAWTRAYGYADVAQKTLVTPETRFQAASISKPVAALAALRLVEEGTLALDQDVNAKLKTWKVPENTLTRKEKVTLRRLLTHTAGLTVHGFPGYASNETVPTLVQVLDGEMPANTPAVRVDTEPGKTTRYSGGGFTILQLMLTDVVGQPFPELMSELVLGPIEMNRSTYRQPLPQEIAGSQATPYLPSGEAVPGGPHTYPEMAAAGLWTTPADLGRLVIEVEREYDGVSRKILTPAMAKQYLTLQNGDFGLGIEVKGSGNSLEFTHAGGNAGYRCVLVDFPERHQGVAIMTNSDSGAQITNALLRSIATEYGWPDYRVIDVTGLLAVLFLALLTFAAYRKMRASQHRVASPTH